MRLLLLLGPIRQPRARRATRVAVADQRRVPIDFGSRLPGEPGAAALMRRRKKEEGEIILRETEAVVLPWPPGYEDSQTQHVLHDSWNY